MWWQRWWWWWWWRENNRNVVVAVVEEHNRKEVVVEENYWILLPSKLYQCALCYHFLSLHSAPEELTWVGSVPFAKNHLVERIACKGTWCLNTTMLVSHHFKQFRFHRNVSGFDSSILLPPWLPEWPGPEKRPGFYLYCNKLQRQFTLPRRGSFGVIRNGSLRIQKC